VAFLISIQNTSHSFSAESDISILQAALDAGLVLPYNCRDGACGACKGRLISGTLDYGDYAKKALPDSEKQQGNVLLCQAKARSDLVIEAREVRQATDIEIRKLPARVHGMERTADDVTIIFLKLPPGERLLYLPGQYVDVLLNDGKRRSFSIGNAPHDDDFLQLHVRLVEGGSFTPHVFAKMKERDLLRLEGPFGTFHLREDSNKPIVFVASGTGFAPIKAIIEHAFRVGISRRMVLYWGGRRPKDLYLNALAENWSREHALFTYVPVISDCRIEDDWHGRRGLVHRAVMADLPDLSMYQVYACGVPVMVDAARQDFVVQCGLPESEFFADSFTTTADLVK